MFDESQVHQALEIQTKSYKLLRWVSEAIDRGFIHFERVHEWTTVSSAASAWLGEHYMNVPRDCKPKTPSGPDFDSFVNYFASFLIASFDIDPNPTELKSQCGCFCPMCAYLTAGKHLRPKKNTSVEKKRADKMKQQWVLQLAMDNGLKVPASEVADLLADEELSRAAALCTYLSEVMRRCKDLPSGPESLALWRQFAWKSTGSPIKGFKPKSKDVLDAQAALINALRNRAAA